MPYPDGRIFVGDSPAGTYDIGIKGFNTLRSTLHNVTLTGGNATGLTATLLSGDANNDNSVDSNDFDLLASSYLLSNGTFLSGTSDPGFVLGADFNYDGSIDSNDFDLLATNYLVTGDDYIVIRLQDIKRAAASRWQPVSLCRNTHQTFHISDGDLAFTAFPVAVCIPAGQPDSGRSSHVTPGYSPRSRPLPRRRASYLLFLPACSQLPEGTSYRL